jgi:hypothetical protein
MTALTNAIVNHDLPRIAAVLAADPAQASVPEGGWLPLQWAERAGNLVTLARTARLTSLPLPTMPPRTLLKQYVVMIATTEYEPVPADRIAELVWSSVFDGQTHLVDRWQRPLVAGPEEALDIRYLMHLSGVSSPAELRMLLEPA